MGATGEIVWSSDFSVTKGGWKICDSGESPVTTEAPPVSGSWSLVSGPCVEDGSCISSPGHPSNYGNGEVCRIAIDGVVKVESESFNTESGYDRLFVNGQVFQGTSG